MTAAAGTATSTDPAQLRAEGDAVLRTLVGRDDVSFRADQWPAIEHLMTGERVLVVQRTGWGKSAVYFVTTALLRARARGPTLIVSPLLALMRNQVDAAERAGIRAHTINSANVTEWEQVQQLLRADEVDLLLVSPERLNSPDFRDRWLPGLAAGVGLVVVDEAHCISDWGHDFRPDYRRIRDLLGTLPAGVPVLATTATANSRVVHDVSEQLRVAEPNGPGRDVLTLRGSLDRESLRLGVLRLRDSAQRLGWLADHLGDLEGSGIIYTLTVAAAEEVSAYLREGGHQVLAYTGRTDEAERLAAEQSLLGNQVKALVATSALGMGYDKPDLGFVIHLGAPASPIAYYQQVGRAGRAVQRADVLLLPGYEDEDIWRYFASVGLPREDQVEAVLAALADARTALSTAALEARVDVRRSRLELLLKVLDVDGAVERIRGGWRATGQPWSYDGERYARVADARSHEQQAMRDYLTTTSCRLEFLRRELDDPQAQPCGRCDTCAGPWYPQDVSAAAVQTASAELSKPGVEVEPRRLWPAGMDRLGVAASGRIPAEEQASSGRALARLSDLGWGQRLRALMAEGAPDGPVPDDVVAGCVEVLRAWGWADRPVAVLAIGSRSRPQLVGTLGARLAAVGRLVDLGTLADDPQVPGGGSGGNSAFRLAGVWGRFTVTPAQAEQLRTLSGPVLLVDDLSDSRWTLTVAARELRRAGAGEVLPLVLGVAG